MSASKKTNRRVCFYHAGCPDGFGAAWSVHRAWGGEGEFVARGHEDRVRGIDHAGAKVVFVDIAPHVDEAQSLAEHVEKLVVLDHHITALERFGKAASATAELEAQGHELNFDMDRSGAVLAWDYFADGSEIPDLLRYVQDQDLWHWALPDSAAVNAAIASYPRDFETWTKLANRPAAELADEGRPIVRANEIEVARSVRNVATIRVDGRRCEAVNSSVQRAQVGHLLAERAHFGEAWGCVYRIQGHRVHATLYSIGDFDVAAIAGRLGGGGHSNAAGFTVSVQEWVERFVA